MVDARVSKTRGACSMRVRLPPSAPALGGEYEIMLNVTELRAGATFKDSQGIWEVVKYTHTKMGRGSATIRVKVKNLKNLGVIEKTFTSGQKVDEIDIAKKKAQFLYANDDDIVFMDNATFEQFNLPKAVVGRKDKFLKEGDIYNLMVTEDQVLGIEISKLVIMKIADTGPAVKGDSVSSVTKDATMENGLNVKVPLFIKSGDKIKVDSRSGEYVERTK